MAIKKPGFNSDSAEPMSGSESFPSLPLPISISGTPGAGLGSGVPCPCVLGQKQSWALQRWDRGIEVPPGLEYGEGALGSRRFECCSGMAFQRAPVKVHLVIAAVLNAQTRNQTRPVQAMIWTVSIRKHVQAPFAAGAAGGRCLLAGKRS